MQLIPILLLCVVSIHVAVGPPVNEKKKNEEEENDKDENEIANEDDTAPVNIEYNRYLKEVVTALESDPEFRAKLEKAEEVDIRTGKIAQELEYVNHQVRTKLDELKRQELERLRHLANKEFEIRNGVDREHLKIGPEHLDHANPHTFEIEDLRKLIAKTTADLAEADKKRREEFKEYEMQKEYEKQQRLQELDEENKKKLEEEYKSQEVKHKKHVPLHHPGSKQQLEEVWEKQDHMENQDFDPKTFFFLHDLDGNGVWDEAEVKALFLKELDKLYNSGAPEDDMRERVEEMERMREHVFSEADTNKDGLISGEGHGFACLLDSFQEFLSQTRKPEFEKDQGWEGLDQQQVYTREEYQEFERRRQMDVQRMIEQGLIPPQPVYMPPPHGYHPGMPPHMQPQGNQGQPQVQGNQGQPQVQANQGQPQVQANQGQPQVQANQGQPQVQASQGQPPPATVSQGQAAQIPISEGQGSRQQLNQKPSGTNSIPIIHHPPEPIQKLREPIDVNQLSGQQFQQKQNV
uniref:NUCB1-like N-terminal domain-containing protein n=1 Tax=Timema monikensis TaxID=170555 RepID=A0A7R9HJD6_9NEOP|nr:unnamed protein product [Timema monikensis]